MCPQAGEEESSECLLYFPPTGARTAVPNTQGGRTKLLILLGHAETPPRRRRGQKFRYTQAFQGYIWLGIWLLLGIGGEKANDIGGLGTQGFLDLVASLGIAILFENLRVLRQYGYQTQARTWKDPSKRQSLLFFILPFSWPKYIARSIGSFPLGNLRQNARFS